MLGWMHSMMATKLNVCIQFVFQYKLNLAHPYQHIPVKAKRYQNTRHSMPRISDQHVTCVVIENMSICSPKNRYHNQKTSTSRPAPKKHSMATFFSILHKFTQFSLNQDLPTICLLITIPLFKVS